MVIEILSEVENKKILLPYLAATDKNERMLKLISIAAIEAFSLSVAAIEIKPSIRIIHE